MGHGSRAAVLPRAGYVSAPLTQNGYVGSLIDDCTARMRNPMNAAADVLRELRITTQVEEHTIVDDAIPGRWITVFTTVSSSNQDMWLEVEVLENNGTPAVCVLERRNCGMSLMSRMMTVFTVRLTDPPRSSQASGQQSSAAPPPPSPSPGTSGPPGGDI